MLFIEFLRKVANGVGLDDRLRFVVLSNVAVVDDKEALSLIS